MKNPFSAFAFLVISISILSLIGYAIYQKDLRVSAEAALASKDIELAGAKKALMAKQSEVVRFVEVPAAVKSAVKKGVMAPIAAGRVEATSSTIEVPCFVGTLPASEVASTTPPQANTSYTSLTFGLKGDFFIGKIRGGSVQYTSHLTGEVWNDTWHGDVLFEPENVHLEIKVSNEVAQAMEYYQKGWFKRHLAVACPIGSISYNPFNKTVSPSISCGFGFVWN